MNPAPRSVLDPTQKEAARCTAPIQLTLAGPGSGKTTTLTARFAHLVRSGVDPRRILAVTFTRKAAQAMEGRIARLVGGAGEDGLSVMTFHAFAYRQLRRDPVAAGLAPDFPLWDEARQRHVFHAAQMWWNEETDITDIIQGSKERLLDAKGFARAVRAEPDRWPECYPAAIPYFEFYEAERMKAGAVDFADLVPLVTAAIAREPAYGDAVVSAFDHLLVDEYQDVNPGQLGLIQHFVDRGARLWAVGDDDQTLYGFRASDVAHVLRFHERHPGAVVHVLGRNYRSTPDIVAAAKTLIRHNLARRDKDYQAVREACGDIVIRGYDTPEDEARQVTVAIRTLLGDGFSPRQVAVLYRSGSVGLPLQAALKAAAIPFEVRGSGDLWRARPAMLAVGALHYLLHGRSAAAMSHLGSGRRADTIVSRLDDIRKDGATDFAGACGHVRRIVGGILPASAAERERREWAALLDAVIDLAESCTSLGELERRIAEQSQALRNPPEHAVVLSTVHSAKGLEWDAVFVVGLEEDVLPNVNAEDVEEERRVAYVALTRSRRLLGLTYVAQRYGMPATVSRFVKELHKAVRMVWSGPQAGDAGTRVPLATAAERSWLARTAPVVIAQVMAPPANPPRTGKRGRVRQARRPREAKSTERRKAKETEKKHLNRAAGKPARYGLAWSPEEEAHLTELFKQRRPLAQLAEALERSEKAVLGRLSHLGFLQGDDLLAAFEESRQRPAQTSERTVSSRGRTIASRSWRAGAK